MTTWVSRYKNVSILDFNGPKDEGCDGNNFTGAMRRAKLQSNRHHQHGNTQHFYRPDALVVQPTVSRVVMK